MRSCSSVSSSIHIQQPKTQGSIFAIPATRGLVGRPGVGVGVVVVAAAAEEEEGPVGDRQSA